MIRIHRNDQTPSSDRHTPICDLLISGMLGVECDSNMVGWHRLEVAKGKQVGGGPLSLGER